MKNIIRQKEGFTLVELLVAISIFSMLAATLFTAYRALFHGTDRFDSRLVWYQSAQSCLNRMAADFGAVYVKLPPHYAKPGFNASPGDDRILGETVAANGTEFGRLRFASLAHLSPDTRHQQARVAEIRYYIHRQADGRVVLKRSDAPFPFPPSEKKETDPILCEGVTRLAFKYFDAMGNAFDDWDSDSADFKYATPAAVAIELAVGNADDESLFRTRIALPVVRKAAS